METIERGAELEAKKAELESRVGEEEAALDAMLESLKGKMARDSSTPRSASSNLGRKIAA